MNLIMQYKVLKIDTLIENEEEIDTDEYIDIYKGNELNTFYIKEHTHNNLTQEAIDFINTIEY